MEFEYRIIEKSHKINKQELLHSQTVADSDQRNTMMLVSVTILSIIGMISKDVVALPCLTDESKTKFDALRKALDDDMGSLVSDFHKRQWKKYNGHCYYYGSDARSWFLAEQSCQQIGGHLTKIDDEAENKWIKDNRSEQAHYWIGLTDLKEGEWRWSYDQTLATYKPWRSGWESKGTAHNCGLLFHNSYTWLDYPCSNSYRYVCESHFCY
ncbi:COLEC12 [Mytilus coruscus]|uniref:COLEC12 n=1 Tax=Mytilus coruscus TaxID=42192 RepID=A0A6J8ENG4_MYTCO|nr:COLEC12 [Mytilus coruscus]